MKQYLPMTLVLILAGCFPSGGRTVVRRHCGDESRKERSEFIIQCAEAANPKSDEEGEDLVAQCEKTAENLYCPLVKVAYIPDTDYTFVPCDQAQDLARKTACSR